MEEIEKWLQNNDRKAFLSVKKGEGSVCIDFKWGRVALDDTCNALSLTVCPKANDDKEYAIYYAINVKTREYINSNNFVSNDRVCDLLNDITKISLLLDLLLNNTQQ